MALPKPSLIIVLLIIVIATVIIIMMMVITIIVTITIIVRGPWALFWCMHAGGRIWTLSTLGTPEPDLWEFCLQVAQS